jgi:hypothetical protein
MLSSSIYRLGVISVALVVVAGCTGAAPKATDASATPSPIATPSGSPLIGALIAQHLVFTGPAPGVITVATTSCRIVGSTRQFGADLVSDESGKRLSFTITVFKDFNGAGAYPVGSLTDGGSSLVMTWGSYTGASSGGAGTNVVGADGKSGTVDAVLNDGERVAGTWACDSVTGP